MKTQTIAQFTDWFCSSFNVKKSWLRSRSQKQKLTYTRHCFCALASHQGFTQHQIASVINRDASTVHSSIQRHKELIGYRKYQQIVGKKFLVNA